MLNLRNQATDIPLHTNMDSHRATARAILLTIRIMLARMQEVRRKRVDMELCLPRALVVLL